jgi:hypothetical protein
VVLGRIVSLFDLLPKREYEKPDFFVFLMLYWVPFFNEPYLHFSWNFSLASLEVLQTERSAINGHGLFSCGFSDRHYFLALLLVPSNY